MPYGLLTPSMKALLAPYVAGKVVWDLGAGDLTYAGLLADLGARKVIAVEKDRDMPDSDHLRVMVLRAYFHEIEVPEQIEVAFLGWPANYNMAGLLGLLAVSKIVVYLGSNVGGSACGPTTLFRPLGQREPLAHEAHRRNSLIIYGEAPRTSPLLPEEYASLTGQFFPTLEDAERAASAEEPPPTSHDLWERLTHP
jgi:hypothetical protein